MGERTDGDVETKTEWVTLSCAIFNDLGVRITDIQSSQLSQTGRSIILC